MQCPTESIGKLWYNILLGYTCNILCMKRQIGCTDICQCIFFLQPFFLYISGSVAIHLLGMNTESSEFQPNSTGFKLVSCADIKFEQMKTT